MDRSQLSQYREALLGGALPSPSTAAPAATPALAPQMAHIQALGGSQIQGNVARQTTNAFGGAAQSVANQEDADAKMKLQQEEDKLQALEKAKEDMADPNKYRQTIDEQGGFKFFDPQGNEIDVKQYSGVTGKHITEILKKSQNPYDKQFTEDYGTIEKLGEVMQKGDKKALEKLYAEQPELKKQIHGKTFNEIVRDFRGYYPRFFNETPAAQDSGASAGSKRPQDISGGGNLFTKLLGGILGG